MNDKKQTSRRQFIAKVLYSAGWIGVIASFGQFLRIVIQYLYPQKKMGTWFFVTTVKKFNQGSSMNYTTPNGQSVVISRIGKTGKASDFIALSNICPHLGCKVYWEGGTKSFFCPCHNGRFDSVGKPLEGPPAKANQQLIDFPLKIDRGLLYIQVSTESLFRISHLNKKHEQCSHKEMNV